MWEGLMLRTKYFCENCGDEVTQESPRKVYENLKVDSDKKGEIIFHVVAWNILCRKCWKKNYIRM
jgi:DNA-directed RNA polymerase subunit RPC12/RpoP